MENIYSDLTPFEVKKALWLEKTRTSCERVAYRMLPKSMRKNVERNHPVAFFGTSAYFPDLLLRKEKICIEIDGRYHKNRYNEDRRRDEAFIKCGYIVIRIKNEDTRVKVAFWERLLEGLEGYEVDREDIRPFVNELRQMIDDEICSWTCLPEDD